MAILQPPSLHLTNPFSSSPTTRTSLHLPKTHAPLRASSSSSNNPEPEPDSSSSSTPGDDQFENRLTNIRLKYRSGVGKKAEQRKEKKGKKTSSSGKSSGIYLPPVALKEAVSGGLKVELGFSPYSERVNGRIAALGLSALLLVELATGKSVVSYHSASVIFLQVYFVAALTALVIKFEKEKAEDDNNNMEENRERTKNHGQTESHDDEVDDDIDSASLEELDLDSGCSIDPYESDQEGKLKPKKTYDKNGEVVVRPFKQQADSTIQFEVRHTFSRCLQLQGVTVE
ncbi:hypothetical protein ACFE04_002259 [Oxalis oulophora]